MGAQPGAPTPSSLTAWRRKEDPRGPDFPILGPLLTSAGSLLALGGLLFSGSELCAAGVLMVLAALALRSRI